MELTPILSQNRMSWFDKAKASWYFEKWWEKLIIILALCWSIFSILKYVYGIM